MTPLALVTLVAQVVFLLTYLIILIKAFRDEWLQGTLCVLLPIYTFYYAAVKMESEHKGLLVTVLFVSLLAGVGLQYAGTVTAKDDPCKLMTKADVEAAFNEPVAADVERRDIRLPAGEGKVCGYMTQALPSKQVGIVVIRNCPSLQPLRERATGMKFPFTDFGDEGYYGGSDLVVRSKNTCFIFAIVDTGTAAMTGITGMSAHEKLRVNRKLAEAAISRLPQ